VWLIWWWGGVVGFFCFDGGGRVFFEEEVVGRAVLWFFGFVLGWGLGGVVIWRLIGGAKK